MTSKASNVGFLNLPISIRQKVYAYLLLPKLEEDVTTINYTLEWAHLENPSNNTFAGPTQIDFCTCPYEITNKDVTEDASDPAEDPQEDGYNDGSHHGLHIYTRYQCHGPKVYFKTPREGLWILDAAYGQFNILRPALNDELANRPTTALLQTCRQVHDEALPYVYRDREFFLTTGPCPRGRYQAYATLQWLQQLSAEGRGNVETFSLLVQPYGEDCNAAEVEGAYAELSAYVRNHLPRFRRLCLDVWDRETYHAANVFHRLFDMRDLRILVRRPQQGDEVGVYVTKESFLGSFDCVAE